MRLYPGSERTRTVDDHCTLPGGIRARVEVLVDDDVIAAFGRLLDAVPPAERDDYCYLGGVVPYRVYRIDGAADGADGGARGPGGAA